VASYLCLLLLLLFLEGKLRLIAWGWLFQRITAVILLFTLVSRLYYFHYARKGALTFEYYAARVQSPFYLAIDLLFFACAIYHGFYGIRGMVLDFATSEGVKRGITLGFILIGCLAFAWVIFIHTAFI